MLYENMSVRLISTYLLLNEVIKIIGNNESLMVTFIYIKVDIYEHDIMSLSQDNWILTYQTKTDYPGANQ